MYWSYGDSLVESEVYRIWYISTVLIALELQWRLWLLNTEWLQSDRYSIQCPF